MQITDYEPKSLWKHFDEIRQIPRCSGHEEQARQWVLAFAAKHGFESDHDKAGNVVIRVPATPGHESAPVVAVQSHLDMVCEKNSDVTFDFSKDAIQLQIDGEWLRAQGTTLGSDNGVGVAAALALADDDSVVHGPLELLFTVDEEVGLTGAGELEPGFINASYLLNLDSEEIGELSVGCAGGGDSTTTLALTRSDAPAGATAARIEVTGLRGGHSGMEIIEQRGNAIKILARALWDGSRRFPLTVASVNGGNKRNAIPREAAAEVYIGDGQADEVATWLSGIKDTIAGELGGKETDLDIQLSALPDGPSTVLDDKSQAALLNLLMAIPHGVVAMSYDIPGLVETSNNLASIRSSDSEAVIGTSSRSSINTALQTVRDQIRSAGELAGATVEENNAYPGWQPNLDSELLKKTQQVHKDLLGEVPEPQAIHAGLECGIIGEKFPGLDMISFGPTIQYPHSPDERINVPSVETFWSLLTALTKALTQ